MCGIFGFYSSDTQRDRLKALRSGLEKIIHRGPDEQGVYESGNFFMGMQRLSIIDLSGGSQPFYNEDETIAVVFNGELYNFRAVREKLIKLGHRFHTHADTEVIAHMFEEYGPEFPTRLNGMFAIALYSKKENKLYLYRDRFGIKPLYYYLDAPAKKFAFSSELKSFPALPFFRKKISFPGVSAYLALGHIPAPMSIYEDIFKLNAGHYFCIDLDSFEFDPKRYYLLENKFPVESSQQLRSAFEMLKDSVLMRTLSDVPLGVFLSGGVDSSAIVALLSVSGMKDISTFSVAFKGEGLYDESSYARLVAEHFGTDHHELEIRLDYDSILEKLFYYYDEPFSDSSAIPTFAISSEAARYVKVVLSGTGGDEVFLGYRRYILMGYLDAIMKILRPPVRKCLGGIAGMMLQNRTIDRKSRCNNMLLYMLRILSFTGETPIEQYVENISGLSRDVYRKLNRGSEYDYYTRMDLNYTSRYFPSSFDFSVYLESDLLVKEDRSTMASSLESRVPFLDHRLVEMMDSIDARHRMQGNSLKYILKKMLRNLVPDCILDRSKQGFAVPLKKVLESTYVKKEYDGLLSGKRGLRIDEFVNRREMLDHIHKTALTDDDLNFLWRLIVLEKFLEKTGKT